MKTRLATHSFGLRGQLLPPVRIITLRALASKRKQSSSASHMLFNIARQRGPLGPEKAIWACLTASNHEIVMILSCDKIYPPVKLKIRDVGSPELLADPCLIPEVGSLAISFRSDGWIRSTSRFKARRATHSFDSQCACSFPGRIMCSWR